MADMPEMQEHFPAVPESRDRPKTKKSSPVPNAGNAGAFSGGACMARQVESKEAILTGFRMPEMQEHFPAVPEWREQAENEEVLTGPECRKCRAFSGGARIAR